MTKPPRIWVSNLKPVNNEVVRVRAQIEHPMESGLRTDETGNIRPRYILSKFEAKFGKNMLFLWEPSISVAPNPYIEFTFMARQSGELVMVWSDEKGLSLEARRMITIS